MKILQKAIPIIMLCFLMLPISILGQEENTRLIKTKKFKQLELKRAVAQAKKLSEGVLIIRLTSNNRKIKALENEVMDLKAKLYDKSSTSESAQKIDTSDPLAEKTGDSAEHSIEE